MGIVSKCNGQCAFIPQPVGLTVIEKSPNDTPVEYGSYDDGEAGVNFTLSLDAELQNYFYLEGEILKVLDGNKITRDVGARIIGQITCTPIPSGAFFRQDLSFSIEKINTENPVVFDTANPIFSVLEVITDLGVNIKEVDICAYCRCQWAVISTNVRTNKRLLVPISAYVKNIFVSMPYISISAMAE